MTPDERVSRIVDKVREVNRRRAQAGRPLYVFNRVLSERKIRAFETKYGISLPPEYRFFLAKLGNGNRETLGRQIFGLASREQMIWHRSRANALRLDARFAFSMAQGRAIVRELLRGADAMTVLGNFWQNVERKRLDPLRGCLVFNYTGSGQEVTSLIVTGSERGKIWIANDYFYPVFRRKGSRFVTFTFLQWVELLLDQELVISAP